MHAAQEKVWQERKRFNVVACGRRWGKTTMAAGILAIRSLTGLPTAWFAPTYRMQEEPFRLIRKWLAPHIKTARTAPGRIETVQGGSIDFYSLDNPGIVARGNKYSVVVIDEAAMVTGLSEAWQQSIRPTLADMKGSAWFLSTPKGYNFFKEIYTKGQDGEDGWASWQMPTVSNPFIDPEEIESARKDTPRLEFSQEWLAEFVDMAGGRIRREWIRYGIPDWINGPICVGVDLAVSTRTEADYTACVAIQRDVQTGNVYILGADRIQAGFGEALQFINTFCNYYRPQNVAVEAVAYQAAMADELIRRTTLPILRVKPKGDKVGRFSPVEARYQQGLVYHGPMVPKWFEDELLTFPHGPHDDAIDAFSYAWQSIAYQPLSEHTVRRLQGGI